MTRLLLLTLLVLALGLTGCGVAPGAEAPAPEPGVPASTDPAPNEPAPNDPAPNEPAPTPPAPTPPAPTADPDDQSVTGTLGGDAQLEGGCVWIETVDGKIEPLLPDGYSTTTDPVALIGPNGDVVAEAGEEVTLSGAPAFDVMTICQVGAVWRVSEIKTGD